MSEYNNAPVIRVSILDLLPVMITLVIAVIVGVTSVYTYNSFFTTLNSTDIVQSNPLLIAELGTVNVGIMAGQSTFMSSIPFVTIMVGVAAMILAYFVPTHPIFLPISFVFWIFYSYASMFISNFMWEFINFAPFASIMNEYPLTVSFIRNLPLVISVMGFFILFILYAKPVQRGGFGYE